MKESNGVQPERFIPFSQQDLVAMLIENGPLTPHQVDEFRVFSRLIADLYHHQFHQKLLALKRDYQAYNPDRDTRLIKQVSQQKNEFSEKLNDLLIAANFSQISKQELNAALNQESLFKIRLFVDFDDFEDCLIYARGISKKTETVKTWFGLRNKDITFINYERVVLYLKYHGRQTRLLKLFRNVPKADLEMLFPNTEVRMRLSDKLLIGLPAAISGGIVVSTKLGGTLILIGGLLGFWLGLTSRPVELDQAALLGLAAGLGALGGYLWKQFNNFKNRKMRFLKTLTENLYFKNLDNNAGVFHRLLDAAEEEECKEAFLAYAFLLHANQPVSSQVLDKKIETWFAESYDCQLDFEIEDALQKLTKLKLVSANGDNFAALPIDAAIENLKQEWFALA